MSLSSSAMSVNQQFFVADSIGIGGHTCVLPVLYARTPLKAAIRRGEEDATLEARRADCVTRRAEAIVIEWRELQLRS